MGPTRYNETAQQGLQQPKYQGKSRSDSGTKHSYSGYNCQRTTKKSPFSKNLVSEVPCSPGLNKRQEAINSSARSKKLTDKPLNEELTYSNKKNTVVREMSPLDVLDIGKKVELQWTDIKSGSSGSIKPKSEVIGWECSFEPHKNIGMGSKLRNFTLSNTSPAVKSAPEKSANITLHSQTVPTSRLNQLYVDLSQFRKHVEILVQQQVWLVKKIMQLKEELHFVMCKMDELRDDIPMHSMEQSHEEVIQSEENTQFERNNMYGSHNLLQNTMHDYSHSNIQSDLSLSTPESVDKISMRSCCHLRDKIYYDKCWNAKASTEDEINGQHTQLDKLLLSEDVSLYDKSTSYPSISTKRFNSGGNYCQLQYVLLLVLMLLQFTVQFVTMFT